MPGLDTVLLRMEGISKRFGSTVALDHVDFDLKKGEIHSLIGENGAGKSTLMKIISGALKPESGRITLDGTPYSPESPIEARKQGIAMIYQELNLAPHLNAVENVMLGIERSRFGFLKRKDMTESVKQALAVLNHLDTPLDVPVYQLGVSSQQIIEIARALVMKAKIIIMDEPTSSLSGDDMETLFTIIRDLKEKGISIIYISHFLEEVMRVADRFTVLRDGQCVGTGPIATSSVEDLITLMLGRKLDEIYSRVPSAAGAKILELDCLSGKKFPIEATLNLHRGEILGITGLIGAGRTEMLNAIFGLSPIRSGKVKLTEVSFTKVTPPKMVARGMGFLSEDRKEEGLALTRSVADNIALSNFRPFARWGWINPRKQSEGVSHWIRKLDIVVSGTDQRVNALSGGNQQKVAIARLLHTDSDILLLDEPTRGIDVKSKAHIYRIVAELAQKGKAVIFVSSYIPELLGICNRIAVMHRGRIIDIQPAEKWDEHSLMLCASVGKTGYLPKEKESNGRSPVLAQRGMPTGEK